MQEQVTWWYMVVVKMLVLLWGTLNIRCRIIFRSQKRDHNFDSNPHAPIIVTIAVSVIHNPFPYRTCDIYIYIS